jgi:hypothetical protein
MLESKKTPKNIQKRKLVVGVTLFVDREDQVKALLLSPAFFFRFPRAPLRLTTGAQLNHFWTQVAVSLWSDNFQKRNPNGKFPARV